MSPLRWLAGSRVRLAVAAAVCWLAVLGAAPAVASYIRDASDSLATNTLILTAWLFGLLVGAGCLAVLVGDLMFPHRWRERVILGLPVPPPDWDDELAPPVPRSHLLGFSILMVILLAAGALALEALTGGLFGEYQRVGHMRTLLRGPNTELKLELVRELSNRRREQRVRDAVDVLEAAWRDREQPEEVRAAAVVSLGQLGASLVSSVESWVKQGVQEHWEFEVLRALRAEVAPDLLAALDGSAPAMQRHLALTLGKLRDPRSAERLLALATADPAADPPVASGAAAALAFLREASAMAPLSRVAPDLRSDARLRATAWAVAELSRTYPVGNDKAIDASFEEVVATWARLAGEGSPARRCDAVHVLRYTGDARVAAPIFALFEREDADVTCETAYVDLDLPAPELMTAEEPLRLRMLNALAMVAVGNAEVLDWARAQAATGRYGDFIQGQLRRLVSLAEAKEGG